MSLPEPTTDGRSVITGASSGIGAALAGLLAARGHALVLDTRREDRPAERAGRLTAEHGVTVETSPCDLADRTARRALSTELAGLEVTALCNNAGFATFGDLHELDPE